MKYRVKDGHMRDQFFVVSFSTKGEKKIEKIFYNRGRAQRWADEANEAKSYQEH